MDEPGFLFSGTHEIMMSCWMIIDCLIAFTWVRVDNDISQGREVVE